MLVYEQAEPTVHNQSLEPASVVIPSRVQCAINAVGGAKELIRYKGYLYTTGKKSVPENELVITVRYNQTLLYLKLWEGSSLHLPINYS